LLKFKIKFKKLINFKKYLRVGGILILNFPIVGQIIQVILINHWFGSHIIFTSYEINLWGGLVLAWFIIGAIIGFAGLFMFLIDRDIRKWFLNWSYDYS